MQTREQLVGSARILVCVGRGGVAVAGDVDPVSRPHLRRRYSGSPPVRTGAPGSPCTIRQSHARRVHTLHRCYAGAPLAHAGLQQAVHGHTPQAPNAASVH